ncbi:hypothetical protein L596_017900 [Steinernema carpocapsae]|uniref:Uncharacterized protein n=1 Tax=Steinernema carpocapsae TaxID=34508 RepID=A0A4U5N3F1_STECR|nr:hypothetical protein L596_017900 [Steinernema carpocapsae]
MDFAFCSRKCRLIRIHSRIHQTITYSTTWASLAFTSELIRTPVLSVTIRVQEFKAVLCIEEKGEQNLVGRLRLTPKLKINFQRARLA